LAGSGRKPRAERSLTLSSSSLQSTFGFRWWENKQEKRREEERGREEKGHFLESFHAFISSSNFNGGLSQESLPPRFRGLLKNAIYFPLTSRGGRPRAGSD